MPQAAGKLRPGGRLGRYELLEELGRGGMGVVFKARDPAIDRLVAIKALRFEMFGSDADLEKASARFAREAQAIGRLAHPNIVTLYDAQREEDLAYLVMEFIAGKSLDVLLHAGPGLSGEQVCAIGVQVCDALEHAHAHGVVHRDIKPANILLQDDGHVKVADFGVAQLAQASTLTKTGTQMGTPSYMSPEQIEGRTLDGRSDLFSLAAVLYELACREKAFPGETITAVIYRILQVDPVPLHEMNKLHPPQLDAALRRALVKDPAGRYQRAREFREALAGVAPPRPQAVPHPPGPSAGRETPPARPRRGPSRILLGGAAAAIAAAGLLYIVFRPTGAPPPPIAEPGAGSAAPAPSPSPAAGAADPVSVPGNREDAGRAEGQDPKAMRVVFAQDVKGILTVGEADTFYRDDPKIVLWVRWANVRGKHTVQARWFDPAGAVAYASPAPEPFDAPAEWWTTWTTLDLRRLARPKPGRWRVELQLDGKALAAAQFTLLDQVRPPAPSPPAASSG